MGIFMDNALKVTRVKEWNETTVSDILLLQVICAEAGLPPIVGERDAARAMEKLEKNEKIPAREIVEFVLRCLDRGWIDFKELYGYQWEPTRETENRQ